MNWLQQHHMSVSNRSWGSAQTSFCTLMQAISHHAQAHELSISHRAQAHELSISHRAQAHELSIGHRAQAHELLFSHRAQAHELIIMAATTTYVDDEIIRASAHSIYIPLHHGDNNNNGDDDNEWQRQGLGCKCPAFSYRVAQRQRQQQQCRWWQQMSTTRPQARAPGILYCVVQRPFRLPDKLSQSFPVTS